MPKVNYTRLIVNEINDIMTIRAAVDTSRTSQFSFISSLACFTRRYVNVKKKQKDDL